MVPPFFQRDLWPFQRESWLGRRSGQGTSLWAPQIESFQRGDQFVVRADLPGLKKEDVTIEVSATTESARADFNNGVLEVTVQAPPRDVSRRRRIEIGERAKTKTYHACRLLRASSGVSQLTTEAARRRCSSSRDTRVVPYRRATAAYTASAPRSRYRAANSAARRAIAGVNETSVRCDREAMARAFERAGAAVARASHSRRNLWKKKRRDDERIGAFLNRPR